MTQENKETIQRDKKEGTGPGVDKDNVFRSSVASAIAESSGAVWRENQRLQGIILSKMKNWETGKA